MRKTQSSPALPDRRRVVLAGTALLGVAALPNAAAAATDAGLAPAADLLAAARKLLSSLDADKRKAASFAWNGPEWNGWNYFGVGGFIKPGLRLEQMNAAQKAAAWDLLATVLSPAGLAKTKNVMLLQDILAASGNGAGQRSSERFSFCFLRHAGRDRSVGLPPGRTSPDPVDRGARRPHRLGHAVLVLGFAQPRHQRTACRPQYAQGRGGAGAPARRRSRPEAAGAGTPVRPRAGQHRVLCGARARQCAKGRSPGRRAHLGAARPDLAVDRDLRGRVRVAHPWPPRSGRACNPAIATRCISPGTARTRRKPRSPTG